MYPDALFRKRKKIYEKEGSVMKFKRMKSALLAGALALSLAAPAFAATDPLAPSLAIKSETKVPTINLLMPTEPAIVLNPYKLKVTLGTVKDSQDPIVSPVMSVTNLSDCPLQVGVKTTVKVGGAVALAADDTGFASAAAPTVVLELKGEIGDKAGTALASPKSKVINTADTPTDLTDFVNDGNVAAAATNTMAAGVNGKAAAAGGVFNFQFTGKAATNAKISWTAKDTVTPTITFNFTPLAEMPT